MEIETLKKAIREYENFGPVYANNIVTPSNITQEDIDYLSQIAEIPASETLLMAKYYKPIMCNPEGFIITDKAVYYKLRPNSMAANIPNSSKEGRVAVSDVTNMGIGEHWKSIGRGGIEHSSGHEVVINGIVAGLLYMGAKTNVGDNQGRADEVNVIFKGSGFDTSYRTEHQKVADNKKARTTNTFYVIFIIIIVIALLMSFFG